MVVLQKDKLDNNSKFIISISFKKIFLLFIVFSFIGCLYEDIYFMIKNFIRYGVINFVTKRGLLYFELSPIYGLGACLMIIILGRKEHKNINYFWYGALIGGSFEYLASLFQEIFTGTTSWNYSNYFLNINGRTTIPYMFFWGLACYFLMTKIYPYFSKKIDQIPEKMGNVIYRVLLVVISLDIFLSFTACIRLGLRHKGFPPATIYGEFLDKYYDDERIRKSYTNMVDKK